MHINTLIPTLFEIAVFLAFNIISFIWDFKFIKWSSMFYAKYTWNGTPYVDRPLGIPLKGIIQLYYNLKKKMIIGMFHS